MHPDFSHLERLSISCDIFLCINFICHLLPLRHGLAASNLTSATRAIFRSTRTFGLHNSHLLPAAFLV